MKLEKGQKLLFMGDSITDCERVRPAGEGLFGALGKGYVSYGGAASGGLSGTGHPCGQ